MIESNEKERKLIWNAFSQLWMAADTMHEKLSANGITLGRDEAMELEDYLHYAERVYENIILPAFGIKLDKDEKTDI